MKNRNVTTGIRSKIPVWLQNLIWFLWERMEVSKKDWLQTFRLSRSEGIQRVEHTQEHPPYSKVIEVDAEDQAVNATVLIIEDNNHATMLLSYEN